jgi:hypothetical protein
LLSYSHLRQNGHSQSCGCLGRTIRVDLRGKWGASNGSEARSRQTRVLAL